MFELIVSVILVALVYWYMPSKPATLDLGKCEITTDQCIEALHEKGYDVVLNRISNNK